MTLLLCIMYYSLRRFITIHKGPYNERVQAEPYIAGRRSEVTRHQVHLASCIGGLIGSLICT